SVETVTYHVTPVANGCTGTPNDVTVTVNPRPVVTFTTCFDPVTTTVAQPIILKGGIPLNGSYSGAGVNVGSFFPGLAGVGNHAITYSYTNMYGCANNATVNISVVNPPPFFCNSNLTDVRDNQPYPTIQIGTQCWMSVNLVYGTTVPSSSMQRDNCIPEKYCFNDNPANCVSYGGLYQWDELMQFSNTAGAQGLCPPGWHVPTEPEWQLLFNFYISNGFAGAPLKSTGYSGFNALLDGTRFNNTVWSFSGFATIIWSSTSHGPYKAWAHGMNTFNPSVSFYPSYRDNAFPVRCLKD
ncbi:MAG TPA: FISUMP domain-containing protein, partial [Bacteroidales bacterium]|nr:FISUMP domain-containing protein [Bacteroidales bacterium]